jgi:hypothetical protein
VEGGTTLNWFCSGCGAHLRKSRVGFKRIRRFVLIAADLEGQTTVKLEAWHTIFQIDRGLSFLLDLQAVSALKISLRQFCSADFAAVVCGQFFDDLDIPRDLPRAEAGAAMSFQSLTS